MAVARSQAIQSKWDVNITVRKLGSYGSFSSKTFTVAALNLFDADIMARQKARKAGYEVQCVQSHLEVIQKAFHKKVVFG